MSAAAAINIALMITRGVTVDAPILEAQPESDDDAFGGGDYGIWADHSIPDDRSSWHPLARRFYEHWREVVPPGRLPGRQHIAPEDIVPLLSRLWVLDVFRNPWRFRYRLVGTDVTPSVQCELTGQWLR